MRSLSTQKPSRTLTAVALCIALQMTGLVLILPLYARRFDSFGAGVQALGVSAVAYALTSTVAAPFIGMLGDRFGRRPVVLFSLAGYVLAFVGFLFANTTGLLIALRGLAGVFTAGLLPAMLSIVGDLVPEKRRAQWIGIVSGSAAAGWIVGPLLGGLLYDRFGYVVPFAASIGLAVAALLLAVILIPETHIPVSHPDRPPVTWLHGLRALPARSTVLLLLLITFGAMFAWAFIEPQFMFYAYDDLGWTSSQLGLVISAFGTAFMLGAFGLGHLSDRRGRKPVLMLGLVLFAAQFIGLVVFREVAWIVLCFVVAGLGNALYDPALSALFLDVTPPEYTARMMGLKSMAGSLGSMLGPALVVLLVPVVSPQAVFLMSIILVVVLILTAGLALHPPARRDNVQSVSETAAAR